MYVRSDRRPNAPITEVPHGYSVAPSARGECSARRVVRTVSLAVRAARRHCGGIPGDPRPALGVHGGRGWSGGAPGARAGDLLPRHRRRRIRGRGVHLRGLRYLSRPGDVRRGRARPGGRADRTAGGDLDPRHAPDRVGLHPARHSGNHPARRARPEHGRGGHRGAAERHGCDGALVGALQGLPRESAPDAHRVLSAVHGSVHRGGWRGGAPRHLPRRGKHGAHRRPPVDPPDLRLPVRVRRDDRSVLRHPGAEGGLRPRAARLGAAGCVMELAGPGAAADSLRAVLDSVFAAPEYRWVERRHPLAIVGRWFNELSRWLAHLRETHPALFEMLFAGLILATVLVFLHAGWVFLRTIRGGGPPAGVAIESGIRRDQAWHRGEADRLAGEGRFVEAMQHEFVALVLALEARQLLKYHPSKTPLEYTEEARLRSTAREEFRQLARSLYAYVFARRPCGPDEFAEWRARAAPERYAAAY